MDVKPFLFWLPMIGIAFVNATIREGVFTKLFGELSAHQLSTMTLIFFCAVYVWLIFPSLNIQDSKQSFVIGLFWIVLTIAFEIALGRLTHKSWAYLFYDYNIVAGRLWPVFLICLFLFPYIFYLLRSK